MTDGETNASLRKGDDVEELTMERALELLADRRARGPAKKKSPGRKKKAPAKKKAAAKKKAPAKKKARQEEGCQEGCGVGRCRPSRPSTAARVTESFGAAADPAAGAGRIERCVRQP